MNYFYSQIRAWQWNVRDLAILSVAAAFVSGIYVTGAISVHSFVSGQGVSSQPSEAIRSTPATAALHISKPIISFNFDDGYASAYEYALPIFDAAGFPTTEYIIPSRLGELGYINEAQVRKMAKNGHEIGAAGETHSRLIGIPANQLQAEVAGAKADLEKTGFTPTTFAYPYGEMDESVRSAVSDAGYAGARGLEKGFNDASSDPYDLRVFEVGSSTKFGEISNAIDQAIAKGEWLILVFSRVDEPKTHDGENVSHELIQQIVNYVEQTGVRVATNAEMLSPQ